MKGTRNLCVAHAQLMGFLEPFITYDKVRWDGGRSGTLSLCLLDFGLDHWIVWDRRNDPGHFWTLVNPKLIGDSWAGMSQSIMT